MRRVVEHVSELGFKKHTTTVSELAGGLLRVPVGVESFLALLDDRKRRSGSDDRLLARGRVHFEMLDATRDWETRGTYTKARVTLASAFGRLSAAMRTARRMVCC